MFYFWFTCCLEELCYVGGDEYDDDDDEYDDKLVLYISFNIILSVKRRISDHFRERIHFGKKTLSPSEDDDAKFGFNHASTTHGGHLHQNGLVLR